MARPNYRQRERTRARLRAINAPCSICGRPIDWSLDWWVDPKDGKRKRHPLSGEYDHAIACAAGGDNTWDNAQPAHRICNQRKGKGMHAKVAGDMPSGNGLPTSRAW